MSGQHAVTLKQLLGPARSTPYWQATGGDDAQALGLYTWAAELSGALHSQLAYVEVAVRNAIDEQLLIWNTAQSGVPTGKWTDPHAASPLLYGVIGQKISEARKAANEHAKVRHSGHPRHGVAVSHDDVVAQLMFGSWVKLLMPLPSTASATAQQELWDQALKYAFPYGNPTDVGRIYLAQKLDTLRKLRNRVAHHENLLQVAPRHRFNDMLAVLSRIDPDYASLLASASPLRRLDLSDPRKAKA